MAGDWIKMRTNLDTDPAVVRISSALKTDRYAVVGRLHKIWSWANEHLTDGQDVPVDAAFLDSLVETPGFAAEMRAVNWLSGRDGKLNFPGFERHNGESAKKRAQDATRKKRVRDSSEKCPPAKRTKSGPEKRREEKSITHTQTEETKCKFLENPDFANAWDLWRRHRNEVFKPLTETEAVTQLMQLGREANSVEDATAMVEFSISKGAKGLITNGDHRKKAESKKSRNGKKKWTLDELNIAGDS